MVRVKEQNMQWPSRERRKKKEEQEAASEKNNAKREVSERRSLSLSIVKKEEGCGWQKQ